jgi:hypothetical protein
VTAAAAAVLVACLALGTGAAGEIVRHENVVLRFDGGIKPGKLPRTKPAPVTVWIEGDIQTSDGEEPPPVRQVSLRINRHGRLDHKGLPGCSVSQIEGATSEGAMQACKQALVGRGRIEGRVTLPGQGPLTSRGELLAFNGTLTGRRVILLHAHVTTPLPGTFLVAFLVRRTRGKFGTELIANFPTIASGFGYMTHFELALKRIYRHRGTPRSYLSASCPVPPSFKGAVFPFARGRFTFENGSNLTSTVHRTCRVRR